MRCGLVLLFFFLLLFFFGGGGWWWFGFVGFVVVVVLGEGGLGIGDRGNWFGFVVSSLPFPRYSIDLSRSLSLSPSPPSPPSPSSFLIIIFFLSFSCKEEGGRFGFWDFEILR